MSDSRFRIQLGLRQEWIRYRQPCTGSADAWLRAGVAAAYLPRVRLEVLHQPQERISESVPQCAAMVLDYHGRKVDAASLVSLLRTDEHYGTPGDRLELLKAWGVRVEFPADLQYFRDRTLVINSRLSSPSVAAGARLVFRWEERWLRYVAQALRQGIPPILFVDLGRLYPGWRGLPQPHAVVLVGGDGRQAWIQDPSHTWGPCRVGLSALMDSLLPGQPLAALLSPLAPRDNGKMTRRGRRS